MKLCHYVIRRHWTAAITRQLRHLELQICATRVIGRICSCVLCATIGNRIVKACHIRAACKFGAPTFLIGQRGKQNDEHWQWCSKENPLRGQSVVFQMVAKRHACHHNRRRPPPSAIFQCRLDDTIHSDIHRDADGDGNWQQIAVGKRADKMCHGNDDEKRHKVAGLEIVEHALELDGKVQWEDVHKVFRSILSTRMSLSFIVRCAVMDFYPSYVSISYSAPHITHS